jgi:hypothetical protein
MVERSPLSVAAMLQDLPVAVLAAASEGTS